MAKLSKPLVPDRKGRPGRMPKINTFADYCKAAGLGALAPWADEVTLDRAPFKHQVGDFRHLAQHTRAGLWNEPGTGKTLPATAYGLWLVGQGNKVIYAMPPILVPQFLQSLERTFQGVEKHVAFKPLQGSPKQRQELIGWWKQSGWPDILVLSYRMFVQYHELLKSVQYNCVVVDECFPRGTKVATPSGDRPIENLAVGDLVISSVGVQRIKRVMRRASATFVEIKLTSGGILKCTPNHPIFTDRGWVKASEISTGDKVYGREDMRVLQATIRGKETQAALLRTKLFGEGSEPTPKAKSDRAQALPSLQGQIQRRLLYLPADLLQPCLFRVSALVGWWQTSVMSVLRQFVSHPESEKPAVLRPGVCIKTHVSQQCEIQGQILRSRKTGQYGQTFSQFREILPRQYQAEIEQDNERKGAQAHHTGRKRETAAITGATAVYSFAQRVCDGLCGQVRRAKAGLSHLLQGRFWQPYKQGSYRGRRVLAPDPTGTREGQEEGRKTGAIRVASVARIERRCFEDVFNLEIENTPHYFAEGVLVHNCTALKSASSQLHDSVKIFAGREGVNSNGVVLMTGTPIETNISDVYGLIAILNPKRYGSKRAFDRAHAVYSSELGQNFLHDTIVAYKNHNYLHHSLFMQGRRVKKSEVSDLPPRLITEHQIALHPRHKALYKKIVDERMVELGDKLIDMTTQSALYQAMQRVLLSPELYTDEKIDNKVLETLDTLLDALEGHKVVVYAWFQDSVDVIAKRYRRLNPAKLYGKTAGAQREAQKQKFITDPACKLLVANPKSGGVGVDGLQHVASHVIFAEVCPFPGTFQQSIDRLHRTGQKSASVNVYVLVPTGTIAVKLRNDLLKKDTQQEQVVADRRVTLHDLFGGDGIKGSLDKLDYSSTKFDDPSESN